MNDKFIQSISNVPNLSVFTEVASFLLQYLLLIFYKAFNICFVDFDCSCPSMLSGFKGSTESYTVTVVGNCFFKVPFFYVLTFYMLQKIGYYVIIINIVPG